MKVVIAAFALGLIGLGLQLLLTYSVDRSFGERCETRHVRHSADWNACVRKLAKEN